MNLNKLRKDELVSRGRTRCVHGHTLLEHPQCAVRLEPATTTGFLDIEASNLSADFGICFSYCIKPRGSPDILKRVVTTAEIRNGKHDRGVISDLCGDIRKFDTVVTYYGTKFDIPFVRTRALVHGLDFPLFKEVRHIDCYYMVRGRMRLSRNRLENACRCLGIDCKNHPLEPNVWFKAQSGDPAALDYILRHNVEDVESLERLYELLEPFTARSRKSI